MLKNKGLQLRLLNALRRSGVNIDIGPNGVVTYGQSARWLVEDAISSIMDSIFNKHNWQSIGFPSGWDGRYRDYLVKRSIPFVEEVSDGDIRFIIPGSYRPLQWKWIDKKIVEDGKILQRERRKQLFRKRISGAPKSSRRVNSKGKHKASG